MCCSLALKLVLRPTMALEPSGRELSSRATRLWCVAPGATATSRVLDTHNTDEIETIIAAIPKGRLAEVDEIVPAFIFLASEESRFFAGQTISPNGGDVML